jgi:hypothetical protein
LLNVREAAFAVRLAVAIWKKSTPPTPPNVDQDRPEDDDELATRNCPFVPGDTAILDDPLDVSICPFAVSGFKLISAWVVILI